MAIEPVLSTAMCMAVGGVVAAMAAAWARNSGGESDRAHLASLILPVFAFGLIIGQTSAKPRLRKVAIAMTLVLLAVAKAVIVMNVEAVQDMLDRNWWVSPVADAALALSGFGIHFLVR